METFFAFILSYLDSIFGAITDFASTPFSVQPFAWIGVWLGCVTVGLLIGWSIIADDRR